MGPALPASLVGWYFGHLHSAFVAGRFLQRRYRQQASPAASLKGEQEKTPAPLLRISDQALGSPPLTRQSKFPSVARAPLLDHTYWTIEGVIDRSK